MPALPQPRGPISRHLFRALRGRPSPLPPVPAFAADPVADEDLQLSLYVCYELHYRGFDGIDAAWEWEPSLIALRGRFEAAFEATLRRELSTVEVALPLPDDMDLALAAIAETDGPPLTRYIECQATADQLREFLIHRSAYQLKEADPHSWALPRLFGGPKAAIVEVQADEYGGGRAERIHAQLFADAMAATGLDSRYGAYLDRIPGLTLATVNLMSLCGLHRRMLGAIVGHLALFEMTSSVPNRRYGNGVRRLGFGPQATAFFDEHVLADAVHEKIAAVELAGGLARQRPELTADILWGARALVHLEERWAAHLLSCWAEGRSSLRPSAESDQLVAAATVL